MSSYFRLSLIRLKSSAWRRCLAMWTMDRRPMWRKEWILVRYSTQSNPTIFQLCCVSCKSFFHGSGAVGHRLLCSKDKKCLVTVTNRRACPKCRLEKCFRMGMKLNSSFGYGLEEKRENGDRLDHHSTRNLKDTLCPQITRWSVGFFIFCLFFRSHNPNRARSWSSAWSGVDDLPLALQVYRLEMQMCLQMWWISRKYIVCYDCWTGCTVKTGFPGLMGYISPWAYNSYSLSRNIYFTK